MKIVLGVILALGAAAAVAVVVAPREAGCIYCYSGDCYNSSICGNDCVCMIPGGKFVGKCFSSGR